MQAGQDCHAAAWASCAAAALRAPAALGARHHLNGTGDCQKASNVHQAGG